VSGDHFAMDRASLLQTIETERQRLETALVGLDDAAMLEAVGDGWTRKDVVAHIEAWERRVVALVEALRAGDTPGRAEDTDALNARFLAESRDRTLEDVRAGERAAYAAMLSTIDACSDEELLDSGHFAWTQGDALAQLFRWNSDEHYDEHLEQLTRGAPTTRS
jgi:hypothetical protein